MRFLLAGPTLLPHVRSGILTALAVSGQACSPSLPEVPTIDEAGVKGYQADFSLILMTPKQVPDDIGAKFRQAVVDAQRTPEATERLKASDQIVIGSTPEQAVAKVAQDFAKWGAVARKIGLSLDRAGSGPLSLQRSTSTRLAQELDWPSHNLDHLPRPRLAQRQRCEFECPRHQHQSRQQRRNLRLPAQRQQQPPYRSRRPGALPRCAQPD